MRRIIPAAIRLLGAALLLALCACRGGVASAPTRAPQGPSLAAAPAAALFRFAVYGDTRDGHDAHRDIVNAVTNSQPALVLQTGDLVSNSSEAWQWEIFADITRQMRTATAYYPARGNHDNRGGEFFGQYVPTEGVRREGFHYSFDQRHIHFVALDTEDDLTEGSPQYAWLDADMAQARAGGKVIIPFYHKAIYSIGPHALQNDVVALRPALRELFRRHGVPLAFQGHDHLYYRTLRDGTVYVVTGGGGAPLYDERHPELVIQGDVSETTHHFCVADVFPDRIEVTVWRRDRTRLDSFTVTTSP